RGGAGRGPVGGGRADLLDELHVAPRSGRELAGVVVAVASPVQAICREQVPLLARDLTRLAADAHGRVGEEASGGLWLGRRDAAGRGGEGASDVPGAARRGLPP